MGAIQVTSSRKGAKNRTHGRKARSTGRKVKTRVGRVRKPRADLERQLETCKRELNDARAQQTATSEVLQAISSSLGDLQPVFNTMLENALRICEAKFGVLFHIDEEGTYPVAMLNLPTVLDKYLRQRERRKPRPGSDLDILCKSRQVVHTIDMLETSSTAPPAKFGGARTQLAVPMLKDARLVGAIVIYRQEVRAFTEKQIDLVKNFATQAVIAIENTRLLNELRESLQQQTATSEVLQVISRSPGALQPVFEAMLEHATRICGAAFGSMLLREGNMFRRVALHNAPQEYAQFSQKKPVFGVSKTLARLLAVKQTTQVADMAVAEPASPVARLGGARTLLNVPMIKENEVIGVIGIYRHEVQPFTEKQIELVTNFAAQAVIAIENTRLLNELRESLQQQTATSEVLQVISNSLGELRPVFETMLENATRLCEAKFGNLFLREEAAFRAVAMYAPSPLVEWLQREPVVELRDHPHVPLARVAQSKEVVHIRDLAADQAYIERDPRIVAVFESGVRSLLMVPMLKDDQLKGVIAIYGQEIRPFSDKQIELVQNFANQAVIAIENARLLNELRESLQRQTATADVLKVISRSTFDLQAVLETLVGSAASLC